MYLHVHEGYQQELKQFSSNSSDSDVCIENRFFFGVERRGTEIKSLDS